MKNRKIFNENRNAFHDFTIIRKIEAGLSLKGAEVRSIRNHSTSICGSYVTVINNELWLEGCNIPVIHNFRFGDISTISSRRIKLLCHRKEIDDIKFETEAKGCTAVPLYLYESDNKIKMEIGIAKGKNKSDKRQSLKENDIRRDTDRYWK